MKADFRPGTIASEYFAFTDDETPMTSKVEASILAGAERAIERAFRRAHEMDRLQSGVLHELFKKVYQVYLFPDPIMADVHIQDCSPKAMGTHLRTARDYEDALRWVMENRKPVTNDSD